MRYGMTEDLAVLLPFDGDAESHRRQGGAGATSRQAALSMEAQARAAAERELAALEARPTRRRFRSTARTGVLMLVILGLLSTGSAEATVQAGTLSVAPGRTVAVDSGLDVKDGGASVAFDIPGVPTTGGLYLGLRVRDDSAGNAYLAKTRVYDDGRVSVGMSKAVAGVENRLGEVAVPGLQVTGPDRLQLAVAVSGSSPVTLSVAVWRVGQAAPTWQRTIVDRAPGSLAGEGSVKPWAYVSRSAGPVTVRFSDVRVWGSSAPAPATTATPLPSAAPTGPLSPSATAAPTAGAKPTAGPTSTSPAVTATATTPSSTVTQKPPVAPAAPAPAPAPAKVAPAAPTGVGEATTGVPAGTKLTVRNGDLVIKTAGAVYDSLDIRGFVSVEAPNVTIKRSIIRGGVAKGSRGVVNSTSAKVKNLVIQDSEIIPTYRSIWLDGISGGNFTLRRVEIDGGVDNAHVFRPNVRIESSYLHDTDYFSKGANGDGGPTHNDGVQIMGGTNIVVIDSRVEGSHNAAVMVTQDVSSVSGVTIKGNRLDDGGCTVNAVDSGYTTGSISLTGNVFGGNSRVAGCAVARTAKTTMPASGNTYANGSAVKINVWN